MTKNKKYHNEKKYCNPFFSRCLCFLGSILLAQDLSSISRLYCRECGDWINWQNNHLLWLTPGVGTLLPQQKQKKEHEQSRSFFLFGVRDRLRSNKPRARGLKIKPRALSVFKYEILVELPLCLPQRQNHQKYYIKKYIKNNISRILY